MAGAFSKPITIRFEHADAEGIMFFGNIYRIVHEVYEDFTAHLGFSYAEWFQGSQWGVPLKKSECEYSAPLLPGKTYDVKLLVPSISESTFTTKYIVSSGGRTHAEVTLVHIFVDRKTRSKTAVPSEVRGKLETYQRESGSTK